MADSPRLDVGQPSVPQIALFFGSRDWRDWDPIERDIGQLPPGSIVVHGGARGADAMADKVARQMGLHVARVDALWRFYGRAAGPRRNEAMLALGVTHAYGYSLGTPGTVDMARRVHASSIPLTLTGEPLPVPTRPTVQEVFGA